MLVNSVFVLLGLRQSVGYQPGIMQDSHLTAWLPCEYRVLVHSLTDWILSRYCTVSVTSAARRFCLFVCLVHVVVLLVVNTAECFVHRRWINACHSVLISSYQAQVVYVSQKDVSQYPHAMACCTLICSGKSDLMVVEKLFNQYRWQHQSEYIVVCVCVCVCVFTAAW